MPRLRCALPAALTHEPGERLDRATLDHCDGGARDTRLAPNLHDEISMTRDLAHRRIHERLAICAALVLTLPAPAAHAWAIGSPLNETGCHEPITAEALRAVRARYDTAPVLPPSRDEAAMIADVLFEPPADLRDDLAGMTLLIGVRENDLKGIDPLASLDLVRVHGDPTTQDEHCIRSDADDLDGGNAAALAACRAFIVRAATEALDGLDASGGVDPARRIPLTFHVGTRGEISPDLPLFYLKMGAALHALEDGFPHTYRSTDGMSVLVVLNWIDLVGESYDEPRDGPGHRAELDRCWDDDPTIRRNQELTTQAATELLGAALDPGLTREAKIQQFDAIAGKYLGFQPGCSFDNNWCAPPEAAVTNSIGCRATGGAAGWAALLMPAILLVRRPRRRGRGLVVSLAAASLVVAALATAHADDAPPAPVAQATPVAQAGPVAQAAPPPAPVAQAEPAPAPSDDDADEPAKPREPGRDVSTPSAPEIAEIRADKQLGSPWGVTGSVGGSIGRAALVSSLGVRYRIREQWVVGLDASWNPWVTTSPMEVRAGVATVAGTLIRRFPMKFDRVNLRSSVHLGVSTLLFDVYGAPKYSTGPYAAVSLLGLDYDLGNSVRIVWDPMEIALPVPLISQLPLYYEQFRFVIGVQIGG
jgi:hypothetical protein